MLAKKRDQLTVILKESPGLLGEQDLLTQYQYEMAIRHLVNTPPSA